MAEKRKQSAIEAAAAIGSGALRGTTELAGQVARPLAAAGRTAAERALGAAEEAASATLDAVLDSPRTERLLDRALARPGTQRLVNRVLDSDLSERTVDRALDSEEMERVVSRIAESPQVRDAVTSQTAGLARDVSAGVRSRAVTADSVVERVARRVVRRPPRSEAGADADRPAGQ